MVLFNKKNNEKESGNYLSTKWLWKSDFYNSALRVLTKYNNFMIMLIFGKNIHVIFYASLGNLKTQVAKGQWVKIRFLSFGIGFWIPWERYKLFLTKNTLTINLGFVIRENMWWVVPRLCLFESFSSTSTLLDPIFSCSVTTAAKCNYEISISCVSQTITNVKTIGSFNMTYFEKGHIRHTYM